MKLKEENDKEKKKEKEICIDMELSGVPYLRWQYRAHDRIPSPLN